MKKRLFLLFLLLAITTGGIWLYNHSFIEISVSPAGSGEKKIYLTNQSTKKSAIITTSSDTIKRIVPRGSYEVYVDASDTSYFAVVTSPGFMRTSHINGEVKKEVSRSFVGNNPSPCMEFSRVLISYACGSQLSNVVLHTPSSSTTPTYISKLTPQEGYVEGSFSSGKLFYFLVRSLSPDSSPAPHTVYVVRNNKIVNAIGLNELSSLKSYKVADRDGRYIIYSNDFTSVYELVSNFSELKQITLNMPDSTKITPDTVSMGPAGDTIGFSFANTSDDDVPDQSAKATDKSIVIITNNGQKTVTIKAAGILKVCGNDLVCAVANGTLVAYDVSTDKPVRKFTILNAVNVHSIDNDLLVSRSDGILRFSPTGLNGYMVYSYGQYSYCADRYSGESMVVCLISPKSKKVALAINLSEPDQTNEYDKKVLELENLTEVKDVSAYKNTLFVSANYGNPVYDRRARIFTYSTDKKQTVNQAITSKAAMLGLNNDNKIVIR